MLEREVENLLCYKPQPNLLHWVAVLNFFEDRELDLTEQQKQALYDTSEWYREHFNKRHEIKIAAQGKEVTKYKYGLNIQKENMTYSMYKPRQQQTILDNIR
ncbi:MAG: hypothetical protein ACREAU_09290 [Nitrosopumilaceae archaeon]